MLGRLIEGLRWRPAAIMRPAQREGGNKYICRFRGLRLAVCGQSEVIYPQNARLGRRDHSRKQYYRLRTVVMEAAGRILCHPTINGILSAYCGIPKMQSTLLPHRRAVPRCISLDRHEKRRTNHLPVKCFRLLTCYSTARWRWQSAACSNKFSPSAIFTFRTVVKTSRHSWRVPREQRPALDGDQVPWARNSNASSSGPDASGWRVLSCERTSWQGWVSLVDFWMVWVVRSWIDVCCTKSHILTSVTMPVGNRLQSVYTRHPQPGSLD